MRQSVFIFYEDNLWGFPADVQLWIRRLLLRSNLPNIHCFDLKVSSTNQYYWLFYLELVLMFRSVSSISRSYIMQISYISLRCEILSQPGPSGPRKYHDLWTKTLYLRPESRICGKLVLDASKRVSQYCCCILIHKLQRGQYFFYRLLLFKLCFIWIGYRSSFLT